MEQEKKRSIKFAYFDAMKAIQDDCNWKKLTADEQSLFVRKLRIESHDFRGSYKQRLEQYYDCYIFFLYGLGFNGYSWRNPPQYEYAVSYEDGEELSRFDTYEDALHQVKTMWEVDHVEAFITKEEVENPKF